MDNHTHPNDVVSALLNHRSTPAGLLDEPAPDAENLATILQCGLSAPDHANVQPWKFITIEAEAREKFGDVLVQAKTKDDPNFTDEQAEALRKKPLRAPMIIAVAASITPNPPKTPRVEQVLTAGVSAQQMQIAARALGFGSIWLTGPMARNTLVKTALGLKEDDELVGFLYIGTPTKSVPERKRPTPQEFTSVWNGPERSEENSKR